MAFNTSGAAAGAGTGAVYGGMYGGPVGAGVGAVAGGVLGLFGGNRKPKKRKVLDPEQERLRREMIQALEGGGGPLADIYNFDPEEVQNMWQKGMVDPAMRNWNEQTVPGITGQFRGQNLQNSSYLGSSLARSGQNLQSDLDAKLAEMMYKGKQASLDRRQQGYQDVMSRDSYAYDKPQPSSIDELLAGLSSGAGDLIAEMAKTRYRQRQTPSSQYSGGYTSGRVGTER